MLTEISLSKTITRTNCIHPVISVSHHTDRLREALKILQLSSLTKLPDNFCEDAKIQSREVFLLDSADPVREMQSHASFQIRGKSMGTLQMIPHFTPRKHWATTSFLYTMAMYTLEVEFFFQVFTLKKVMHRCGLFGGRLGERQINNASVLILNIDRWPFPNKEAFYFTEIQR